ncbi:MAG: solute carrier family 23 protein [Candidatus Izemoplasmatales bacterium]|jgi:uracil permease|nr:solute carrier family 23 protein [Candidatus Izemoplasmatales bacterium]
MVKETKNIIGYLPDERPSWGKLILFAFQHILVMFPATVLVALLTGFHISTTIFASGLATLCFILVTKGKIPLYYGSSFSYIAAIIGITCITTPGEIASDALIGQAQFGIILSGFVSIGAGLIVNAFGFAKIQKVLPPAVTGPVAMIIGLSLAGTALSQASGYNADLGTVSQSSWAIALITLISIIVYTVIFKKGVLSQLPILLGILTGYVAALLSDTFFRTNMLDFSNVFAEGFVNVPHFTLPVPSWTAVFAIMPIALATIPESTAHLFQIDLYVNDLAKKKATTKKYPINDKLGLNLIGDGIGDIVSGFVGGPAGTNYGENISTMAITKNFSIWVLGAAAIFTMIIAFFTPLANLIYTLPSAVIGGASIYLFGVIAAQGIAIMIEKKVDMFDAKNMAIIAVILIFGVGGSFLFGGVIPMFGMQLPAIATAAIAGILLNAGFLIGTAISKKTKKIEAIQE